MRVLMIAGAFAPNRIGGPALIAERVAAGLQAAGEGVAVLTAVPDRTVRYGVGGLPVVGVPAARAERVAGDLLEVLRPDVVHMHSPRMLGAAPLALAQARGLSTVVSIYGAEPQLPPALVAAADAIVVDNAQEQQGLGARVVPNGVPPAAPGWSRPERRGPLRLGYIGGLDPDQGYSTLLQALVALRRSDYELHVVDRAAARGTRSLRPWDFRVPGLVRLIPGMDPAAMPAWYGSIDVLLCLPATPGHVGLAMREAMMHGVWPVATHIPANAAVIEHGVSGDLVPVGSAADLAEAVGRLVDDPPGAVPTDAVPTLDAQVQALRALYTTLRR